MRVHKKRDSKEDNGSLLTIFQAVFGLPIAFSVSVEGSIIEIKPATPVPEDNTVSLKLNHTITSEQNSFVKIHESKIKKSLHCS